MSAPRAKGIRRPPPRLAPINLRSLWHSTGFRALLFQAAAILLLVGGAAFLIHNAMEAMAKRGITTGFGFLTREAGFPIGEALINYSSEDSYLRAYAVAILNTLKVSVLSVILATVLGTLLGMARLSRNWLIAKLSTLYVELFRNTPQLVQIVFWYTLVTHLPSARQAWHPVPGIYISKRGIDFPWPEPHSGWLWALAAFAIAFVAAALLTGRGPPGKVGGLRSKAGWLALAIVVGAPVLVWWISGAPVAVSVPALHGFNFVGGLTLSPEFFALLLGLSLYIAAFIAEIVRSGIQSVPREQIEAARAIGLKRSDIYRKVVLPQALRVIIPPAAAQYVSTIKNSSLGVAIGYPELFNVNNTIVTLSGNTVEAIVIMMAVYLTISFVIAAIMNAYNRAVQIPER